MKSKRFIKALCLAVMILALLSTGMIYSIAQSQQPRIIKHFSHDTVTIASGSHKHIIEVELALSDDEIMQGLMYRKSIAENTGMLFIFKQSAPVDFWMKNTFIPLDIFFINEKGIIINIVERAEPLSLAHIPSTGPVLAVIEMGAGSASRLHIAKGDKVVYSVFHE